MASENDTKCGRCGDWFLAQQQSGIQPIMLWGCPTCVDEDGFAKVEVEHRYPWFIIGAIILFSLCVL